MCAYLCTESLVVNEDSGPRPLTVMQRRYSHYTSYFVIIDGESHGCGLSNSDAAVSFLYDTHLKFHIYGIMKELPFCNWPNFHLTSDLLFDLNFLPAKLTYVPGV